MWTGVNRRGKLCEPVRNVVRTNWKSELQPWLKEDRHFLNHVFFVARQTKGSESGQSTAAINRSDWKGNVYMCQQSACSRCRTINCFAQYVYIWYLRRAMWGTEITSLYATIAAMQTKDDEGLLLGQLHNTLLESKLKNLEYKKKVCLSAWLWLHFPSIFLIFIIFDHTSCKKRRISSHSKKEENQIKDFSNFFGIFLFEEVFAVFLSPLFFTP
jgi:hypothetical protein